MGRYWHDEIAAYFADKQNISQEKTIYFFASD